MAYIVNQLNMKRISPDTLVKGYGFLYQPPINRGRAIVVDEIVMDHMWPVGCNLDQLKVEVELNPGGQFYIQIGGGLDMSSGFWTPAVIESEEDDAAILTEVSDMFTLPKVINEDPDNFG